jgi:hypothetical protein
VATLEAVVVTVVVTLEFPQPRGRAAVRTASANSQCLYNQRIAAWTLLPVGKRTLRILMSRGLRGEIVQPFWFARPRLPRGRCRVLARRGRRLFLGIRGRSLMANCHVTPAGW